MRRFLARYQSRVHYFDMVNDYGTVLSARNRERSLTAQACLGLFLLRISAAIPIAA
jgi:hypothetical protein